MPDDGAATSPFAPVNTRCLCLAGPTAVGKSAIALLLAERLHGEIISVDSMQVYRGLDIGTAKPTAAERARVPHYLLDIVDLTSTFDAAQFVRLARRAAQEITARGRLPILCGGTGLYFKAFLEGLGEAPPADPALRAALGKIPLPELLRELAEHDPVTFERIDRQNPRRVVRAVEVIRLTGRPFSVQRAESQATGHVPFLGFTREPADLHARINARVDEMFASGLVAEIQHLLKLGLERNQTAMQAIGYRQIVEHLRGEHSLADTIVLVKQRTRQFAKRQMTWFRRQTALTWWPLASAEPPGTTADRLAEEIQARQYFAPPLS